MEKQEQSFAFADTAKQPDSVEEQRKVVSLSSATKLTPVPTNSIKEPQTAMLNSTSAEEKPVKMAKAVKLTSEQTGDKPVKMAKAVSFTPAPNNAEPIKMTKAVALTPEQAGDKPVKMAKAVSLTPASKNAEPIKMAKAVALTSEQADKPVKMAKAVSLTPAPKNAEPIKMAKAVEITPEPIENKPVNNSQTATASKIEKTNKTSANKITADTRTGPTRKMPIPINSQKGVQLTDENIAQRLHKTPIVTKAETKPTQKITIPPVKNNRINLNEESPPQKKQASPKKSKKGQKTTTTSELKVKFGEILKQARIDNGLSPAAVEDITKIRSCYIEALEVEDFTLLPPIVYICAYVKTLCTTYKIDKEIQEKILADLKKLRPTHLSDETIHNLNIDCEIDEAEEHRLKVFITTAIVAIIIICLVSAVSIWLMNSDHQVQTEPAMVKTTKFNRDSLIVLSPPQSIKMTILNPHF